MSIDIVLPWVNGNDPDWQKMREKYSREKDYPVEATANYRFRDWGNLKYWFRAVEKFMPWVNRVFFITCGHLPDFMNISCDKLSVVKHSDYIPEKYLPTFNTNTIEMNLHRIESLSENFILFNDDVFPIKEIEETYFFIEDKICDSAIQSVTVPQKKNTLLYQAAKLNNVRIINQHFNKRAVLNSNYDKWFNKDYSRDDIDRNNSLEYWDSFTGFKMTHMANSYKKSIFRKIWELEYEELDRASKNRFRYYTDITDYLIRYWQLCEGNFVPRKSMGTRLILKVDSCRKDANFIINQKDIMVSIEDESIGDLEFEIAVKEINTAFESLLPEKSSFEL